mmetsp:Transcript_33762/g.32828  ORF Transcript_33762/g.32828 Transcript_33762/m.32828 type:complete len:116 (-) Transcript_33762:131-478(-)
MAYQNEGNAYFTTIYLIYFNKEGEVQWQKQFFKSNDSDEFDANLNSFYITNCKYSNDFSFITVMVYYPQILLIDKASGALLKSWVSAEKSPYLLQTGPGLMAADSQQNILVGILD